MSSNLINDIGDIDLRGESDSKSKKLLSKDNFLYCTENLFFPSFYSENDRLFSMLSIRYKVIRALTFKMQCIPTSFPIIGGRTLIELINLLIGVVFCIYLALYTNTGNSGSYAAIIAGIAICLGLRNNIFTLLFNVSFERAIFWHKIVAVLSLVAAIIHGVIAVVRSNFTIYLSNSSIYLSIYLIVLYQSIYVIVLYLSYLSNCSISIYLCKSQRSMSIMAPIY
jgi:hypothetical protein